MNCFLICFDERKHFNSIKVKHRSFQQLGNPENQLIEPKTARGREGLYLDLIEVQKKMSAPLNYLQTNL